MRYLEVFWQRPFWYKKVFSEQHFSKTRFQMFLRHKHHKVYYTSMFKEWVVKNVPSETRNILRSFLG